MRRQLCSIVLPVAFVVCCSPTAFVATAAAVPSGTGPHARCSNCHHPDTGDAATVVPPGERCVECHAGDAGPGTAAAARHLGFGCAGCHDPHGAATPFRFRRDRQSTVPAVATLDPVTRMCVSCHVGFAEARGMAGAYVRHPVGVPVRRHGANVVAAGASPARGAPLQLPLVRGMTTAGYVADVVGCGTCHHLHGNGNPKLLRWAADAESDACLNCHEDAVGAPVLAGE